MLQSIGEPLLRERVSRIQFQRALEFRYRGCRLASREQGVAVFHVIKDELRLHQLAMRQELWVVRNQAQGLVEFGESLFQVITPFQLQRALKDHACLFEIFFRNYAVGASGKSAGAQHWWRRRAWRIAAGKSRPRDQNSRRKDEQLPLHSLNSNPEQRSMETPVGPGTFDFTGFRLAE